MNARRFKRHVLIVIIIYAVAIATLFALRMLSTTTYPNAYATFKDALPLIIAIPALWLGYCLQRRQTYLKDVRDLWSKLVVAGQGAIQYTHLPAPEHSDYTEILTTLTVTIEEIRGVFSNVGEAEFAGGIYPFEGIKEIHRLVSKLGWGNEFTTEQAEVTRREIVSQWKLVRDHYLSELERGVPVKPDSPYLK
jgi:hypothetical protein